jgi:hypothetical protein
MAIMLLDQALALWPQSAFVHIYRAQLAHVRAY